MHVTFIYKTGRERRMAEPYAKVLQRLGHGVYARKDMVADPITPVVVIDAASPAGEAAPFVIAAEALTERMAVEPRQKRQYRRRDSVEGEQSA